MEEVYAERWEQVATAAGMAQANIILGRLESEGIPVKLNYEAVGTIYAVTVDGLGEVKILVPRADQERARELLARSFDDRDLPWQSGPDRGTSV